jgi:hypothetical protein
MGRVGDEYMHTEIWLGNLKRRFLLGDLEVEGR